MNDLELAIVMPIYNEEGSIEKVFKEWVPALDKISQNYKILALDDGSLDQSFKILMKLSEEHPNKIIPLTHANCGHGQTCIKGYLKAISLNARWVLQIDSDGQCDPIYIKDFWQKRSEIESIFGYRKTRDDGLIRLIISRILAIVAFLASGVYVRDPNVPYRLIQVKSLSAVISRVPKDFYLANILVSILLEKQKPISWRPIHFRNRFAGQASLKKRAFAKLGLKLFFNLIKMRFQSLL